VPTPDELEHAADRLRGCARSGRIAAQALATHIVDVAERTTATQGEQVVLGGTPWVDGME